VRARRAAPCTLVLLAAGVLAGCAAHQRTPLAPGDLPPLLPVAASAYDYVAGPPAVAVVRRSTTEDGRVARMGTH
jgi:hypothetical protein